MMTSLSSSQKLVPSIDRDLMVSLNLKRQIVKAIGLTKGHWFRCPNGHFYCISECGGAMEEAKCPEPCAMIGGQCHTL